MMIAREVDRVKIVLELTEDLFTDRVAASRKYFKYKRYIEIRYLSLIQILKIYLKI